MQMLVYENYNKFISATDTIRSMKSNVDGMDSNMSELKTVIGTAVLAAATAHLKSDKLTAMPVQTVLHLAAML